MMSPLAGGCRRFESQHAVVTGGGSGIGRAAAVRLAAEGASVTVVDVDAGSATETVACIQRIGGQAAVVLADQSDAESIGRVVKRLGAVDVLCVNAAVADPATRLDEVTLASWDRMHAVNLRGAFLVVQQLLPALLQAPAAAVVFTASLAAMRGLPGRLPYAASKGGLVALSHALAVELGGSGIRVNTVCPGGTRTPGAQAAEPDGIDAAEEALRTRVPLNRIAEPEDVAAAIAFLASSDARHITGVDLIVDGGQSIRP